MFPNIQSTLIAATVAFVAGCLISGITVYRYEEARWTAAIEAQKAEAARQLQVETEKVLAKERKYASIKDQLERTHAENRAALDRAYADARRAVAAAGGLRDPGRRPSGGCPVSPTAGATTVDPGRAPEARLSPEAEEFLWQFARDADAAAEYARTCHDWAMRQGGAP